MDGTEKARVWKTFLKCNPHACISVNDPKSSRTIQLFGRAPSRCRLLRQHVGDSTLRDALPCGTMSMSMPSDVSPPPPSLDNNASSRRRTRHHTTVEDPHLQVLGRDGRDLPLFAHHDEDPSVSRPPTITTKRHKAHWWDGMTKRWNQATTKDDDISEPEAPYASLVVNEDQKKPQTQVVSKDTAISSTEHLTTTHPASPASAKKSALSTCAVSLLAARSSEPSSPTSSSTTHYSNALPDEPVPTTREDEILSESSFFYRDMDEMILRAPSSCSIVLPPQERSAFRARYQQLNQEHVVDEHDLDLWETDNDWQRQQPPTNNTIIQDFSNSSLYYKQDGRVLMKLPKDKVRLVMDPELGEPGILSAVLDSTRNHEYSQISYVLTVPPDIYRKVVLELAHKHTTICSSCFQSEEKLSIRVAIGLLIVILMLLFINVIIYPGD